MPHEHKLTGSLERELAVPYSASRPYVYKKVVDNLRWLNREGRTASGTSFHPSRSGPGWQVGTQAE